MGACPSEDQVALSRRASCPLPRAPPSRATSTDARRAAGWWQTITALAVDAFGGPVTRAAAEALIATARAKLTEAEGQVCPGFGLPCTDQRICRAIGLLALAQNALGTGDYQEAARYARETYRSAELAEELHR